MKNAKTLGLFAVVIAAMLVFAGGASAGPFTSPDGTTWTGDIHLVAGETVLHGVTTTTCQSSTLGAKVTSHGSGVTGKAQITDLALTGCNQHVSVLALGTLEFHTHGGESSQTYAIVTWTGGEISTQITSLGITCIFSTNNTEFGTMTNSTHQQGTGVAETAVLHVDSAEIPRTGGSFFCGSSGEWTATYEITTPMYLDYD